MQLRFRPLVLLCLAVLLTAFLCRLAVLRPIYSETQTIVLDRPIAFVVIAALVFASAISWSLVYKCSNGLANLSNRRRVQAWLLLAAILLGTCGVGIALVPKPTEPLVRNLMGVPNIIRKPPDVFITHTVYFENGSSELSLRERERAHRFLHALSSCPQVKIEVIGFASTAPFVNDPEGELNRKLANFRGHLVSAMAMRLGISAVTNTEWTSASAMFERSGVADKTADGKRVEMRELLNRRVDISFELPPECRS